jgi:hypothetical protein
MAFWLNPDWAGGDNIRDGAEPFWMRGIAKPAREIISLEQHSPYMNAAANSYTSANAQYQGSIMNMGLANAATYYWRASLNLND